MYMKHKTISSVQEVHERLELDLKQSKIMATVRED